MNTPHSGSDENPSMPALSRLCGRHHAPAGEQVFALEHRGVTPVLVRASVAARQVGTELAWRVALETLQITVTLRGRVAARLRPLMAEECRELPHGRMLCCDSRGYARRRDRLLKAMLEGADTFAVLRSGELLLARLDPLPSPGMSLVRTPGDPPASLGYRAVPVGVRVPLVADKSDPPSRLTPEKAKMVEGHLGLVRRLAGDTIRGAGRRVIPREEFEAIGYEALVGAAMRYDPMSPATLATFARFRVQGAMIDALRKHSQRERVLERAWIRRRPLAHLRSSGEAGGQLADEGLNPEEMLEEFDVLQQLRVLITLLPPADRELLQAVYYQKRSMSAYAAEVGTSCATVSRRHARVIERLRRQFLARGMTTPFRR